MKKKTAKELLGEDTGKQITKKYIATVIFREDSNRNVYPVTANTMWLIELLLRRDIEIISIQRALDDKDQD